MAVGSGKLPVGVHQTHEVDGWMDHFRSLVDVHEYEVLARVHLHEFLLRRFGLHHSGQDRVELRAERERVLRAGGGDVAEAVRAVLVGLLHGLLLLVGVGAELADVVESLLVFADLLLVGLEAAVEGVSDERQLAGLGVDDVAQERVIV